VNPRRLYRSRDRQLAGIAGGMAEYLDIDPTVSRILWIVAAIFTGGLAILAYIVLAFIIPENPYASPAGFAAYPGYAGYPPAAPGAAPQAPAWSPDWQARAAAESQARTQARGRGLGAAAIVGAVLIVFGAIALADALLPAWAGAVVIGPAVIIALGAALLVGSLRRTPEPVPAAFAPASPAAATAPEPAPVATPVTDPAPTAAGPWEVTDTQAVDPAPGA
jgi:phage shock protein C